MTVERVQILNLYKQLLRYSNTLTYTNKAYYLRRVKEKFRANQDLTSAEDVEFYYKVSSAQTKRVHHLANLRLDSNRSQIYLSLALSKVNHF